MDVEAMVPGISVAELAGCRRVKDRMAGGAGLTKIQRPANVPHQQRLTVWETYRRIMPKSCSLRRSINHLATRLEFCVLITLSSFDP